jgi:outer membrane lipoprotein carrier protein
LETFVQTVRSGKASFVQVVTAPTKAGQAPRQKTSSGTFEFSRPNRFKFVYVKPFAQTLVADGQTLWLWDVDLNQVTARKQAEALGSTPAALIASATSVRALAADFTLTDAPATDGLEWVLATPKSKDSSLQSVRIGFKGASLERLDIQDSFGQQSVLTFNGFEANAALDAASFQFKPPVGADVVRQ